MCLLSIVLLYSLHVSFSLLCLSFCFFICSFKYDQAGLTIGGITFLTCSPDGIPWCWHPHGPDHNELHQPTTCSTTSIFLRGTIYNWHSPVPTSHRSSTWRIPSEKREHHHLQDLRVWWGPGWAPSEEIDSNGYVRKKTLETYFFGIIGHLRDSPMANLWTPGSCVNNCRIIGGNGLDCRHIGPSWPKRMHNHHRGLQPMDQWPPNRRLLPVSRFQPRFCSWHGFSSAWSTRTLTRMLS